MKIISFIVIIFGFLSVWAIADPSNVTFKYWSRIKITYNESDGVNETCGQLCSKGSGNCVNDCALIIPTATRLENEANGQFTGMIAG